VTRRKTGPASFTLAAYVPAATPATFTRDRGPTFHLADEEKLAVYRIELRWIESETMARRKTYFRPDCETITARRERVRVLDRMACGPREILNAIMADAPVLMQGYADAYGVICDDVRLIRRQQRRDLTRALLLALPPGDRRLLMGASAEGCASSSPSGAGCGP